MENLFFTYYKDFALLVFPTRKQYRSTEEVEMRHFLVLLEFIGICLGWKTAVDDATSDEDEINSDEGGVFEAIGRLEEGTSDSESSDNDENESRSGDGDSSGGWETASNQDDEHSESIRTIERNYIYLYI
uniref:Uncharacterized protein n=1 Tax=Heterorhabditis bacteriophora TaxID=37862 RepID=A0A1I7WCZ7_HETBA